MYLYNTASKQYKRLASILYTAEVIPLTKNTYNRVELNRASISIEYIEVSKATSTLDAEGWEGREGKRSNGVVVARNAYCHAIHRYTLQYLVLTARAPAPDNYYTTFAHHTNALQSKPYLDQSSFLHEPHNERVLQLLSETRTLEIRRTYKFQQCTITKSGTRARARAHLFINQRYTQEQLVVSLHRIVIALFI